MNTDEKILQLVFILSGVILFVFIAYIIYAVIRQQRLVSIWQQARIAAEIKTLENERKRIAGDLHDELGPLLSAVKMQINHLEPTDEKETVVLEKSSVQIDGIIKRFREISYDLLPNTLVRKGFNKALKEYIEKMKLLHPLVIEFKTVDFTLDASNDVNLFRMVQEIIQNTIKHSRADTLSVNITIKNSKVILETSDNGIGFKYNEKVILSQGVGLLSLQSRAQLLGGELKVETKPGHGTTYKVEIPL